MVVNKKRLITVVPVLLILAALIAQPQFSLTVSANSMPYYPFVILVSPPPMQSINSSFTPITVRVIGLSNIEHVDWLRYSLDGQSPVPLRFKAEASTYPYFIEISENYYLYNLPDGRHTIVIEGETTSNKALSLSTYFWVDTTPASPSPTITPSPSPSPTSAPTIEPTAQPTSTPKQQSGFFGTSIPVEFGYAIVAVLVIVVTAGLSLGYYKRLRKQKVES